MQKIRYFPPERQQRSITPIPATYHRVMNPQTGNLVKVQDTPIPPVIDQRSWPSVAAVRSALAKRSLGKQFANRALYESARYENAMRQYLAGFVRGKPKNLNGIPPNVSRALYAKYYSRKRGK